MWIRANLKANAKAAFKRNYWRCVLVAILLGLAAGSINSVSSSIGSTAGSTSSITNSLITDEYEMEDDMLEEYSDEFYDEYYEYEQAEDMIEEVIPGGFSGAASTIFSTITLAILAVISIFVIVLTIFVLGPLEVGCRNFFKNNANEKAELDKLTVGFKKHHYWKMVGTVFFRNLYTALWSFLLVVPGIIKAYEYRMITYILTDCPDMSRQDAFRISKEMMKGNKWDAFILDLSFLGWSLLAVITCGLAGLFYVSPYIAATDAELFIAIREEYFKNQRG